MGRGGQRPPSLRQLQSPLVGDVAKAGLAPPEPAADGRPMAAAPQAESERLDYCIKSETTIEVEPATLAAVYMNVDERQKWHSACQDC